MTPETSPTSTTTDDYPSDFINLYDKLNPKAPALMATNIGAGDQKMEAAFCEHYYNSTFKLLCSLTRDPFRAEDMTHEVLLKVLVRLRTSGIDHPDRLTSFVQQTARFTFIGWYRQMERFHWCESMDEHADHRNAEAAVLVLEQASLMNQLIEEMQVPRDREVLIRSYICDETKQSICESLQLNATHFDRVISRARKRLRQLVDSQDEGIQLALADVA